MLTLDWFLGFRDKRLLSQKNKIKLKKKTMWQPTKPTTAQGGKEYTPQGNTPIFFAF